MTIQSTSGIVSGIDYISIVNQLIEIDAKPIQNLIDRTTKLENEQSALTELQSLYSKMAYMVESLNKSSPFETTSVTSSNESIIAASRGSASVVGSHIFTALKMAQAQQTVSTAGVVDKTVALGYTGTISVRNGSDMQSGFNYNLDDLNGGDGVAKGYVRVVDADGKRATIDLRNATTINDVIDAFNGQTDADIYAYLDGDHIVVSDLSGGAGKLTIQDVGNGTTAKSLGLATRVDISNPTTNETGSILIGGVAEGTFSPGEIAITDTNGNNFTVDLTAVGSMDDVVMTINAAAAGIGSDLRASYDESTMRLTLADNPPGSGRISVSEVNGGSTASSLALVDRSSRFNPSLSADGTTMTGGSILYVGYNTRLSILNDGNGIATEGTLDDLIVTFDDGTTTRINFSTPYQKVVLDDDGNPVMTEPSNPTWSSDGKTLTGGTVDNQVALGQIRVANSAGVETVLDLTSAQSSSDIVDAFNNNAALGVTARYENSRLILTDTAGGTGTLTVSEVNSGTTAKNLGLVEREPEIQTTTEYMKPKTVGDILNALNGVDTGVAAALVDGRITIVSSRVDNNNEYIDFQLNNVGYTPTLQSLGLIYSSDVREGIRSSDATIMSRPLIGTFNSALVASLNGGVGYGVAQAEEMFANDPDRTAKIQISDRSGASAVIEISAAEFQSEMQTIEGAIALFNRKIAAARDTSDPDNIRSINLTVRMNESGSGFEVVDGATGLYSTVFEDINVTETLYYDADDNLLDSTDPLFDPADATRTETVTRYDHGLARTFGIDGFSNNGMIVNRNAGFQTINFNTKLSDLNGGKGISTADASIIIYDSTTVDGKPNAAVISLNNITTVGELIQTINRYDVAVTARINDTGDGIILEEHGGGPNVLSVADLGNTTFAADFGIAGTGVRGTDADGNTVYRIKQSFATEVEVEATDSLEDIVSKLNKAGGNFTASILQDGSDTPYRLMISGNTTGAASRMVIDLSAIGMETRNLSEAQDALVAYGDPNGEQIMMTSSTNTFSNIVSGVTITVKSTSNEPVTVSSERSSSSIKASLTQLVETYNAFWEKLMEYTQYTSGVTNYQDGSTVSGTKVPSVLTGHRIAVQLETKTNQMFGQMFYDLGSIRTLSELGLKFVESEYETEYSIAAAEGEESSVEVITNSSYGFLEFDEDAFDRMYAENPDAIREFFFKQIEVYDTEKGEYVTKSDGFAARFKEFADSLVTGDYNACSTQYDTYQKQIDRNQEKAEWMLARLEAKRTRLLKKFYAMEETLAKLQTQASYLDQIGSGSTSTATA